MQRVIVIVFLALLARPAAAGTLAGVALPESVIVDGKSLVLNGMGIRKATIFNIKVYVAGLYLESKLHSGEEVIRSEQIKRYDVVLLRHVDRDDITDVFWKGLKKNGADMAKIKTRFDQFARWLSDFDERDTLSLLYVPGRGVTVTLKGTVKGTIEGGDFARAMFSIWLGRDPSDDDLKDALLGK
jgi:aromatic ring-cleaving dioxygenase